MDTKLVIWVKSEVASECASLECRVQWTKLPMRTVWSAMMRLGAAAPPLGAWCLRVRAMDVYKVEQGVGQALGQPPPPEKTQPTVSFDAGSEFNLNFFDSVEDRESTQGFSDPGSVGSAAAQSPPPAPQASPSLLQLQPCSSSSSSTVKSGTANGVC